MAGFASLFFQMHTISPLARTIVLNSSGLMKAGMMTDSASNPSSTVIGVSDEVYTRHEPSWVGISISSVYSTVGSCRSTKSPQQLACLDQPVRKRNVMHI